MDQLPAGTQLPQDKDEDNKRAQEEQMRRDLLATVLDTAARERCASPSIVNVLDNWSIVKYPGSPLSAQSGPSRSKQSFYEWLNQVNSKGGWPKDSWLVFSIRYLASPFQHPNFVKIS